MRGPGRCGWRRSFASRLLRADAGGLPPPGPASTPAWAAADGSAPTPATESPGTGPTTVGAVHGNRGFLLHSPTITSEPSRPLGQVEPIVVHDRRPRRGEVANELSRRRPGHKPPGQRAQHRSSSRTPDRWRWRSPADPNRGRIRHERSRPTATLPSVLISSGLTKKSLVNTPGGR